MNLGSMASRVLGLSSLGGRAASARCSPARHAINAATSARAAVSLTQVYRAAPFTSAVNNGDAAPATGSEEDRERTTAGDGPVSRAAEKAADVGGKVRDAAEEVKEAGRDVKDRAREVGEDVKESVKETR